MSALRSKMRHSNNTNITWFTGIKKRRSEWERKGGKKWSYLATSVHTVCAVTWGCAPASNISRLRAMSVCLTLTHFCSLVRTSEPHPLSSVIDVLWRPGLCLSSAPVRQLMKALLRIHTFCHNTSTTSTEFSRVRSPSRAEIKSRVVLHCIWPCF